MKKVLYLLYFLLTTLLLVYPAEGMAQQTGSGERLSVDLQAGLRTYHRDSLPDGKNIDFLNFLDTGTGWDAFQFIGLTVSLKTSDRWTFTSNLKLYSDFGPGHFGIASQYSFRKACGLFHGGLRGDFGVSKLYINQFNQYHVRNDSGFIADLNPNYRQINLTDLNLGVNPFATLDTRRFHLKFAAGAGINLFIPFSETIVQKQANGNLKRELRYNTKPGTAIYADAELTARFDLLKSEDLNAGIMLQAGVLFSRRALPYLRETNTWTYENTVSDDIRPAKEWFSRSDVSMGIYLGL